MHHRFLFYRYCAKCWFLSTQNSPHYYCRSSVLLWCKMSLSLYYRSFITYNTTPRTAKHFSPRLTTKLDSTFSMYRQYFSVIFQKSWNWKDWPKAGIAIGSRKTAGGKINCRYTRRRQVACAEYSWQCSVYFVLLSDTQQWKKWLQKFGVANKMLCLQSHWTRRLKSLVQKASIIDICLCAGQKDVFHSYFYTP